MPEDDPRKRSRRDPEPEIAAAEGLFHEDPVVKSRRAAPKPAVAPGSETKEVFELVEGPSANDPPTARPTAPVPSASSKDATRQPRAGKTVQGPDQSQLDPSVLVQEVWSRNAEWGPTLMVLGGWGTFIVLFVYFGPLSEYIWWSLLTLILGAMVAVVLSYPIWITLERPVRVTPEQAVRDYYGSLSHHFPHFRRMWLLLSSTGRVSTAYGSLEGFKAYWRQRLRQLREGHAGSLTPLAFEVADFRADKSAGQIRIDAEFALKVWVRGKRGLGAIQVIPLKIALVRGPDKMWYLEDGTLPSKE